VLAEGSDFFVMDSLYATFGCDDSSRPVVAASDEYWEELKVQTRP